MTARTERLATELEATIRDLRTEVERSTDEQWRSACPDGAWTQGHVAFHAAASLAFVPTLIGGIAQGQPFTPTTMANIDEMNAANAPQQSSRTKAQTLEAIEQAAPTALGFVRSLSDDQLDRKAQLLENMPAIPVEQIIEMLLIGHTRDHRANISSAR